jgi:hypothetical protein
MILKGYFVWHRQEKKAQAEALRQGGKAQRAGLPKKEKVNPWMWRSGMKFS